MASRTASTQVQTSPPKTTETAEYFSYTWDRVERREEAAFAIHTIRNVEGKVLSRLHESYKPIPTQSTDPKTGSHGH